MLRIPRVFVYDVSKKESTKNKSCRCHSCRKNVFINRDEQLQRTRVARLGNLTRFNIVFVAWSFFFSHTNSTGEKNLLEAIKN